MRASSASAKYEGVGALFPTARPAQSLTILALFLFKFQTSTRNSLWSLVVAVPTIPETIAPCTCCCLGSICTQRTEAICTARQAESKRARRR